MKHPQIQELTSPKGFTMYYTGQNPSYWTYAVQLTATFEVYRRAMRTETETAPCYVNIPNIHIFNSVRKKQIWHKSDNANRLEINQLSVGSLTSHLPQSYTLCKNSAVLCKFSLSSFGTLSSFKFEIPNNPIHEAKVSTINGMTFYRFNLFGSSWELRKDFQISITVPPRMNVTLLVPIFTILADHVLMGKNM